MPRSLFAKWVGAAFFCAVCVPGYLVAGEWVVISMSDREPRVLEAAEVQEKEGMVTLRDGNGKAIGAWQKESVSGRIAQFPKDRETWTGEKITSQLKELEAFVMQYSVAAPLINPAIEEARAYIKGLEEKAAAEEAEKQKGWQKRLEAVRAVPPPERASPPALAGLQTHIAEVRELIKVLPAEAAKLEEDLKLWVEIEQALVADQSWFEGAWKTPKEIETLQETRRKEQLAQAMEKIAAMPVPGVVASADHMKKIKIGAVASVSLCVVAMVIFFLWRTSSKTVVRTKTHGDVEFNHSGGILEWFKIAALLASLALVGVESFYVYKLWFGNPGAVAIEAKPESSEDMMRLLYASSRPEGLKVADVPKGVSISQTAINAHLARHLAFSVDNPDGALVRTAWAVRVSPQAVQFQENLKCDNRQWTALYEIVLTESAAGTVFSTGRVTVDGLPVPNLLGGLLWNGFQADLLAWVKKTNLDTHYTFAGVDGDKVKFALKTMPPVVP
jgi:hypothetical protein